MLNIGVVIPCRNYGHFLSDNLRTLVAQETALRVAIVNDGGSDGVMLDAVAEAFRTRDVSIEVLHMPASRGVGLARNTGAAYLNTDLFFFIDADDWLHPGAVDALCAALRTDPAAAFAYGDYTQEGYVICAPAWDPDLLEHQNIASYCNLWRRQAFWQIGGYSAVDAAEDWEIQRRAMAAGLRAVRSDALVFDHRVHDKNKWTYDAARLGGLTGVGRYLEDYGKS